MTETVEILSEKMRRYIAQFCYDDFFYLSVTLPITNTCERASNNPYLDLVAVENNRGGDCIQLSHHFARTVLEPLALKWDWLVSTDEDYDTSEKAKLIPFRSAAIRVTVPEPDGASVYFYLGIPLGHSRPIRICNGSQETFWGKKYIVETRSADRFRLWTKAKNIDRFREYYVPDSIDFQSAWKNLIYVKDNYSITAYHTGKRHFLGYNLLDDRVYYTLRTAHLSSKRLDSFLRGFAKNAMHFDHQLKSVHLYQTLLSIRQHREVLRQFVSLGQGSR
jgi:hypothetical protein